MPSKVAFLINPLKRLQLNSYVAWVKARVPFHLEVFDQVWPSELGDFDQVWVMGGDGTFNYFVNKYPSRQSPLPSLAAHAKNPAY